MRKAIIAVTAVAMLAAASSAAAAPPPTVQKLCHSGHQLFCTGHWTTLGGKRVYEVGGAVNVTGSGAVIAKTGYQQLQNHGVGLCLSGYTGASGAIEDEFCNGSANQTWNIYSVGLVQWTIQNKGSGLCANNRAGNNTNYNIQVSYRCDGDLNEQFRIDAPPNFGNGLQIQTLKFVQNGVGFASGYCWSSRGFTLANSYLELFDCNGSANQSWGQD